MELNETGGGPWQGDQGAQPAGQKGAEGSWDAGPRSSPAKCAAAADPGIQNAVT